MSLVTIRDAIVGDIAALTAIYAHHVLTGTATFEIDPPDVSEMERRWQHHADQGWPYLVATRDDVVLGYAYAAQFRDRAAYARTAETSIYLDHREIRRGVGRQLLGALLERGGQYGFDQFVAVVGDSANAGSIGLHLACGFEPAGLLKAVGRKFGRSLDVVYLQLGSGTGSETASF